MVTGVRTLPESDRRSAYGAIGRSRWLDVDWREHQRWVEVMEKPVNVIDLGEGPPLVFVHGLSGSWPNWLEQLPVFATDHRVIAMDLPGFGHSPMPAERITISAYARMLDGLLEALGVSAATLVGNSMGGFVSAELAISYPQRVERLVLVSAAGISTYEHPLFSRWARVARMLRPLLAAQTGWVAAHAGALASRPGLRERTLDGVARHPSRLPGPLAAEMLRGAGKPGFVEGLEAIVHYDFRHRLPEVVCPALIVWGDRDRLVSVRDASAFEQSIPDSRKVIFEGTGHMAMLERPAAFNALLREFLSE